MNVQPVAGAGSVYADALQPSPSSKVAIVAACGADWLSKLSRRGSILALVMGVFNQF